MPVKGIGLDFVSSSRNLQNIISKGFPKDKKLIAGVINGRNVWRTDIKKLAEVINQLKEIVGEENLILSNAQPLFHLPITVEVENELPEGLKERLAFAKERLQELKLLKEFLEGKEEAIEKAEKLEKLL